MNASKCRICGAREHNHRCQGGTPAMRIEERARVRRSGAAALARDAAVDKTAARSETVDRSATHTQRRWHDDSDAAGEPTEVRDLRSRPARFYAPPNQCVYCDRRREAARKSMAAVRERGTDA